MDVANAMIAVGGDEAYITNLKLNKLVYYAYVEALRSGYKLFCDDIEAWQHGPVVADVYHAFKRYGHNRIPPSSVTPPFPEEAVVAARRAIDKYGFMTAMDIRDFSHRGSGAWVRVYDERFPHADPVIADADILDSMDGVDDPADYPTMAASADSVKTRWSAALDMLKNS